MIGNLRTRLGVYVPQTTPDDLGGVSTVWVLQAKVWAHIKPQSLSEGLENGRVQITRTYKVTIRWQKDFPERARLSWGDKILRVLSAADPDTRHERLHLICEEEEQ